MENSTIRLGKGEVLVHCHAVFLDNRVGSTARGFYSIL